MGPEPAYGGEPGHRRDRFFPPRYSEFRLAIARGKDPADARMAVSLYERGVGFTGPDGRYYPPDVNAASLWLRNRQPHLWRDRVEHEHNGGLEQRLVLMTREQRLAEADRLLEDAARFLPLLEQQEAEEAATIDTAVFRRRGKRSRAIGIRRRSLIPALMAQPGP